MKLRILGNSKKGSEIDEVLWEAIKLEIESKKDMDQSLKKLLEAMKNRLVLHRVLVLKNKRLSNTIGAIMAWSIPIVSALITFLASLNTPAGKQSTLYFINLLIPYLPIIGLLLTILTILNSVYNPIEKSLAASHTLIRLHDWEMTLFNGLTKHKVNGHSTLDNFLFDMDKKLSTIGENIASLLVPKDSTIKSGS